jgi:putative membrane protein insertion efficiency factor
VNVHRNPARALLVSVIRGYQALISPALPRSCKYYPSCSQYAIDALTEYGVLRGLVLSSWRLLRCNPLSYGGYDPVERQTLFAPRSRGDLTGPRALQRTCRLRDHRTGMV